MNDVDGVEAIVAQLPTFKIKAFRTALKVVSDIKKHWVIAAIILFSLTSFKMFPVCINKEYTALPPNHTVRFIFAILYALALPMFVVPWMKRVYDPKNNMGFHFKYGRDEIGYLLKVLLVVVVSLVMAIPLFIIFEMMKGANDIATWTLLITGIVYIVFAFNYLFRFVLIIPAAALAHKLTLKEALALGKGNAGKIFLTFIFTSIASVLIAIPIMVTAKIFGYIFENINMYHFLDHFPDFINYLIPGYFIFFFPNFILFLAGAFALSVSTLITAGTYAEIYKQLID
ncbi:MAG: hypothetical protein ABIK92_01380 [Pseudomonadota bacterium]